MVDVEVDDRDAPEPALDLRVAGCDGDVVHEAEAHRAGGEGVVSWRPHEREGAAVDRFERDARSEGGGRPRGLRGDSIGIEQRRARDLLEPVEVRGIVDALELLAGRASLDGLAGQPGESLLPFRVVTGRVEQRVLRIGQRVDVASSRSANPSSPSSRACAAAPAQSGSRSWISGSGAVASSVAIRR